MVIGSCSRERSGAMQLHPETFRIRLARPDEVMRLREIEDIAGTLFSGLGLIDEELDSSFPLEDLSRLVNAGQAWVAQSMTFPSAW